MNSRNRLVVLLLAAVVLLSGCVMRVNAEITIKDDSAIDIVSEYAFDTSKGAQIEGEPVTKDNVCTLVSQRLRTDGSKNIAFDEGGFVGCRSTERRSLELLSALGILRREGLVYHFRASAPDLPQVADPNQVSDFKVSVSFPDKVLSHNGSSTVAGNTVTWTDPKDLLNGNGLEASGQVKRMPMLPWLIASLGAMLAAAVIVVIAGRRDRWAYAAAAAHPPPPRWGEPGNQGNPWNQQP